MDSSDDFNNKVFSILNLEPENNFNTKSDKPKNNNSDQESDLDKPKNPEDPDNNNPDQEPQSNGPKKPEDPNDNNDCNELEFKAVILTVIVAGLTWVVAVAWSGFMETVFETCYPEDCRSLKARFIYFIIVTIAAIIIIYYLSKWLS